MGTCTCRLDSRNREISRNQAWKQKLDKSVSFNYYFFGCTLNDTLTAKNGDQSHRQHPKWYQNPWFVPETTSILSTFAYRSSPPPPRVLNICRIDLLRRRANARNVSFRISLRWLTYIVNSVDKTKLSCNTPTDAAPQFLQKLTPFICRLRPFHGRLRRVKWILT